MCVAILVKPGAEISIDALREGASNNRDGAGYAFILDTPAGPVVKIVKALHWYMIEKQYKHDKKRHGATSPFIVHFRIASHGSVSQENCHPFSINQGGALIHNGMIPFLSDRTKSDTATFAETLRTAPDDWQYTSWVNVLEAAIGRGNKMCMLWPDGSYLILNETAGFWKDDVWYSNHSCEVRPAASQSPLVGGGKVVQYTPRSYRLPPTGTGTTSSPPAGTSNGGGGFASWLGRHDKDGAASYVQAHSTAYSRELEREIARELDAIDRIEQTENGGQLAFVVADDPLDSGIYCAYCDEDLSTPFARLHHDKETCDMLARHPTKRVREATESLTPQQLSDARHGRRVVPYPDI